MATVYIEGLSALLLHTIDAIDSTSFILSTSLCILPPSPRGSAQQMPHSHSVDNCSLRFCGKGRQLDLGKSRSRTQFSQRNQLPASDRFWAYVCVFGPVVMEMVMVPKTLSQVGWLRQRQHQSIHRLKAFYWPKLPETQSFQSAQRFLWKRYYCRNAAFSRTAPKQASQSGSPSGSQAGSQTATQEYCQGVCLHQRSLSAVKTG
jgi:hypothetical protein